eukprot:6315514-Prymnesium_polylepis.1
MACAHRSAVARSLRVSCASARWWRAARSCSGGRRTARAAQSNAQRVLQLLLPLLKRQRLGGDRRGRSSATLYPHMAHQLGPNMAGSTPIWQAPP